MSTPWQRIGTSHRQVDRAGRILRDWTADGLLLGPAEREAMDLLDAYRAEFSEPLTKVVMGLRSALRTERVPVIVAQRLKRQPRIIGKLIRYPGMELSRMQDIGGCRAILPELRSVEAVQRRILRQKSEILTVDDYNVNPKTSGYRAVHLIVRRDMTLIEIQLRTPWQQEWATLVEDIDGAMRLTLKDETGPDELLRYLRALAYAQWEQHGLGELSRGAHWDLDDAQAGAEVWLRSRGASR